MPTRTQYKSNEEYNAYFREYREKNKAKVREYYRKYNSKYRKEHGYQNEKNSAERYPEKQEARRITYNAIRTRVLKKKPCEVCGAERVHAHHDDYSKPLEVRWLCPAHHMEHHKNQRNMLISAV
jgi:transketolase